MKNSYVFNNINEIKEEFNTNLKDQFNTPINTIKLISLMIYANYIIFGYYPRDTQLISFLLFLNKKNFGLIQQVKTGEGKSLIISFLAIYLSVVNNKKSIFSQAL